MYDVGWRFTGDVRSHTVVSGNTRMSLSLDDDVSSTNLEHDRRRGVDHDIRRLEWIKLTINFIIPMFQSKLDGLLDWSSHFN